jgi:hypothetical protein
MPACDTLCRHNIRCKCTGRRHPTLARRSVTTGALPPLPLLLAEAGPAALARPAPLPPLALAPAPRPMLAAPRPLLAAPRPLLVLPAPLLLLGRSSEAGLPEVEACPRRLVQDASSSASFRALELSSRAAGAAFVDATHDVRVRLLTRSASLSPTPLWVLMTATCSWRSLLSLCT